MATLPITERGQVITPANWAPAPAARLAARLLALHSPHEIAEAITVLIDVLDLLGGDPEQEDDDPAEEAGDERDISWPNRIRQDRIGPNMGTEDDEDDDPREEDGL